MMKTMYMLRTILAVFFSCLSVIISKAGTTCVYTQKQFDKAIELINQGKEMSLRLHRGTYRLSTSLNSIAPLKIQGNGAVITCSIEIGMDDLLYTEENHHVYRLSKSLPPYTLFYDKNGKIISVSESVLDSVCVNYLEGTIGAPREYTAGTYIKIPISSNLHHLKNKFFDKAFGYVDCGWTIVDFALEKSDSYFFYCKTLSSCSPHNYMYDKTAYHNKVRFVIYNAERKDDAIFYNNDKLYVPKNIDVLNVVYNGGTEYPLPIIKFNGDTFIEGVSFTGITYITVNSQQENRCIINNCKFLNTIGSTLTINKENGSRVSKAIISNCIFEYCSLHTGTVVFLSSNWSGNPCIKMNKCKLSRYPDGTVGYKNTYGVVKLNGDVVFEDNVVFNTSRVHVNCGAGNIVVRNNILYNTDDFNSNLNRNLSSDWGIIYCDHQYTDAEKALNNKNHRVLLQNNLLYGAYGYGGDARGVFIDDGRGDVICVGNVILNTQIYSIDSRKSTTSAASVRNRYVNNILTSNYRLAAGTSVTGSDTPITDANILTTSQPNVIQNVIIKNEDERLANLTVNYSCRRGKIYVSSDLLKIIKKCEAWKNIKKYVSQKDN